jgi:hypothetical protein
MTVSIVVGTSRMLHFRPQMQRPKTKRKPTHLWRVVKRVLVALAIATPLSLLLLWYAIHKIPWLGPKLADGARVVLGPRAVSWIEERAYKIEDRYNRWSKKDEAPKAHWDVPDLPEPEVKDGGADTPVGFRPKKVGPLFPKVAAKGDGVWVPVVDPDHAGDPPRVYKTLIHPDESRSWAELFVVAMDARRVRIAAVAGTKEPAATTAAGAAYRRTGLIPERDRDDLLAAFNGGFKTEHGQLGMRVDGVTLLPAKKTACTVAAYKDGALKIGSWKAIEPDASRAVFWRQGPACMLENGDLHPGLASDTNASWGSAVGGDTVIRRSALGLSPDGATIFMGISNYTTARALALGMQHVGAADVVQLDVNWSYPHVVVFRKNKSGKPRAELLFDGFVYQPLAYTVNGAERDYFYVTRVE